MAAAREAVRRPRTTIDFAAVLPTPEAVAERVRALRAAIYTAITPEDVHGVVQGVVFKAKLGDLRAAQVLLDLIGSGPEVVVHDKRKVIVTNKPPPARGRAI